jgi:hypothetical protein
MSRSGVHPLLLIGLLSLAASTLLEAIAGHGFPVDLLRGWLDGMAVVTIYGYLLGRRTGRLRKS